MKNKKEETKVPNIEVKNHRRREKQKGESKRIVFN